MPETDSLTAHGTLIFRYGGSQKNNMNEMYEPSDLRSCMSPDETVIWSGTPAKKPFFLKTVFNFLLPVAIAWTCIDIPLIVGTLTSGEEGGFDWLMIPFMLLHMMPVWLYLFSILVLSRRYKNTAYLLTDRNLYISGGIFARNVDTLPLARLNALHTDIGLIEKKCGVGSIRIGDSVSTDARGHTDAPTIAMIADYDRVCKLIQSLQQERASDMAYPNSLRPE